MVKTPFDGEAKNDVKITRKQKERKLKTLNKVFGLNLILDKQGNLVEKI